MPVTVDDVRKQFEEPIAKAKGRPELIAQLERERDQEIAAVQQRNLADRERQVWVREALLDYPLARHFAELLVGDTEEAVKESAKVLHERLDGISDAWSKDKRMKEMVAAALAAEQQPPEEKHEDGGS